jgi:uncharacterized protein (DUF2267 family)
VTPGSAGTPGSTGTGEESGVVPGGPEEESDEETGDECPAVKPHSSGWTVPHIQHHDLDTMRSFVKQFADEGSSYVASFSSIFDNPHNSTITVEQVDNYRKKLCDWLEIKEDNQVSARLKMYYDDIPISIGVHLGWVLTAFMYIETPSNWPKPDGTPATSWDDVDAERYKKNNFMFELYQSFFLEMFCSKDGVVLVDKVMTLITKNLMADEKEKIIVDLEKRILQLFDDPNFIKVPAVTLAFKEVMLKHLERCLDDADKYA